MSTTQNWPLDHPESATIGCAYSVGALAELSGLDQGRFFWGTGTPQGNDVASSFAGFARRLHLALDFAGFIKGRSRTGALAKHYDVSRETARKWLSALALPELDRMIGLAMQTGVAFEWLATGRGDMTAPALRVREESLSYIDREELRLVGIVRRLPSAKRRALIVLLDKE